MLVIWTLELVLALIGCQISGSMGSRFRSIKVLANWSIVRYGIHWLLLSKCLHVNLLLLRPILNALLTVLLVDFLGYLTWVRRSSSITFLLLLRGLRGKEAWNSLLLWRHRSWYNFLFILDLVLRRLVHRCTAPWLVLSKVIGLIDQVSVMLLSAEVGRAISLLSWNIHTVLWHPGVIKHLCLLFSMDGYWNTFSSGSLGSLGRLSLVFWESLWLVDTLCFARQACMVWITVRPFISIFAIPQGWSLSHLAVCIFFVRIKSRCRHVCRLPLSSCILSIPSKFVALYKFKDLVDHLFHIETASNEYLQVISQLHQLVFAKYILRLWLFHLSLEVFFKDLYFIWVVRALLDYELLHFRIKMG